MYDVWVGGIGFGVLEAGRNGAESQELLWADRLTQHYQRYFHK